MIITTEQLRQADACKDQVELFQSLFGDSVDVTEAICTEYADQFDFTWAAMKLLSNQKQIEYEEVRSRAGDKYERIRAPAWAKYERSITQARAEYDKVLDKVQAEYDQTLAKTFGRLYSLNKRT